MIRDVILSSQLPDPEGATRMIVVGRRPRLLDPALAALLPVPLQPLLPAMVDSLSPGDLGDSTTTWLPGQPPRRVTLGALPDLASRHNCPARPDAITSLVGKAAPKSDDVAVLLCLDDPAHALAAACAAARPFHLYSRKGGAGNGAGRATICLISPEGAVLDPGGLQHAVDGVRLAARLVDTPACEMTTDVVVAEAARIAGEVGARIEVVQGEDLERRGFGGLYSVGRAAARPPALVHLGHGPDAPGGVAWVGKGIVYDTGGLALKGKTDMPGMKADMGGAAAVLGAFAALVRAGYAGPLHAILCVAENAVGPLATRPDDIITLYSGRSVEVNNPDAEGRLVVADGVAYAARHLQPSVIVDLATLTGAQLIATGKRHGAVVSNDEAWERRAVEAGRAAGDLLHPLPYCPELYRKEFKSQVADLKNSVKDRNNAQSSCAAQFIAEHLGDYGGPWVHVDMAGPVVQEERGTGYGVALLWQMFGR